MNLLQSALLRTPCSHLVAVYQLRLEPAVLCWWIEAGHSSDQLSLNSTQPLHPNLDLDSAPTLCVIYFNSDDSNDTEQNKIHNPFPNHQKVESQEKSENAPTIRHKRYERKGLHLFSYKGSFGWKNWPNLCSCTPIEISIKFRVFCDLQNVNMINTSECR